MSDQQVAVMDTKLEILIKDFQRFRDDQHLVNKELMKHGNEENEVQAKILTTQKWHTVIGSFMMGAISYLMYSHIGA